MEKMKKSIMTENIHFKKAKKPITSHGNQRSIFHTGQPCRRKSPNMATPPANKNKSFKDIGQKRGKMGREYGQGRKGWYADRPETSKGNRISSISKKNVFEDCELCWKQLDSFDLKNSDDCQNYGTDVLIILNKKMVDQKQKPNYEDKFQTHLSSDFLNLFAD